MLDYLPHVIPVPDCPVTMISGAPGSGKSTWVRARCSVGEIVIDVDEIKGEITGSSLRSHWQDDMALAELSIEMRNDMLRSLSGTDATHCWFIVCAAEQHVRRHWIRLLRCESLVLDPGLEVVLERIERDPDRRGAVEFHKQLALKWYESYSGCVESMVIDGQQSKTA